MRSPCHSRPRPGGAEAIGSRATRAQSQTAPVIVHLRLDMLMGPTALVIVQWLRVRWRRGSVSSSFPRSRLLDRPLRRRGPQNGESSSQETGRIHRRRHRCLIAPALRSGIGEAAGIVGRGGDGAGLEVAVSGVMSRVDVGDCGGPVGVTEPGPPRETPRAGSRSRSRAHHPLGPLRR